MTSFYKLFAGCALLALTSCGFPGVRVDNSGLGPSPIAKLLTQVWMNSPDSISSRVSDMLKSESATGTVTVAGAKSAGFDCGATLVGCKYSGEVRYRFLNLPEENASRAEGRKKIVIVLTSENPLIIHTDIDTQPHLPPG